MCERKLENVIWQLSTANCWQAHEELQATGMQPSARYFDSITQAVAQRFPDKWKAYAAKGATMNVMAQQQGVINEPVTLETALANRAAWVKVSTRQCRTVRVGPSSRADKMSARPPSRARESILRASAPAWTAGWMQQPAADGNAVCKQAPVGRSSATPVAGSLRATSAQHGSFAGIGPSALRCRHACSGAIPPVLPLHWIWHGLCRADFTRLLPLAGSSAPFRSSFSPSVSESRDGTATSAPQSSLQSSQLRTDSSRSPVPFSSVRCRTPGEQMYDRLRAELGLTSTHPGVQVSARSMARQSLPSNFPQPLCNAAALWRQREATSELLKQMNVSSGRAKARRPWNTSSAVKTCGQLKQSVGVAALANSDISDFDSVALEYVKGRQKSLQDMLSQHARIGIGSSPWM